MNEIFNHDRIAMDEMIDRFGIERFMQEVKDICKEKASDKRRTSEERELLHYTGEPTTLRIENVDRAVGELFNFHGGAAIITALIKHIETLSEDWDDADMKRQAKRMADALQLKTVRDAWGIE